MEMHQKSSCYRATLIDYSNGWATTVQPVYARFAFIFGLELALMLNRKPL